MAAGDPLTSVSDLIAMASASTLETIPFTKKMNVGGGGATSAFGVGPKQLASLWRIDGSPAGATAIPSTAAVCTNATTGALKQGTPATGARKYILSAFFSSAGSTLGSLLIYDRLCHQGGLSGTTTGAQTTNLPTAALTRRTTGVGVEPWLEIYSSLGSTPANISASYTNDAGSSGQTTDGPVSLTNSLSVAGERLYPLPLQLGSTDKGVRAVASVTLSGSTGTAGNFGITLAYPFITLPLASAGAAIHMNMMRSIGAPLSLGVDSDSCLALAWFILAATTNFEGFGLLALGER